MSTIEKEAVAEELAEVEIQVEVDLDESESSNEATESADVEEGQPVAREATSSTPAEDTADIASEDVTNEKGEGSGASTSELAPKSADAAEPDSESASDEANESTSGGAASAAGHNQYVVESELDYLGRIREAQNECELQESVFYNLRERANGAKKAYETSVLNLRKIIRDGRQRMPLFEQRPQPPATPAKEVDSEANPKPEDWRQIPVDDLDLTEAVKKSLIDAGLETVGKIADYTAADRRLTDIKGIGKAKVEKIELALEQVWANRKAPIENDETDTDDEPVAELADAEDVSADVDPGTDTEIKEIDHSLPSADQDESEAEETVDDFDENF